MNRVAWDRLEIPQLLAGLTFRRARFRVCRIVDRLRSPRRLIATSLAIGFFGIYLLNGIYVVSSRAPADPERLRLWLSGGMVIYALYHAVRCAWSDKVVDLELSEAERLWLGGGPIQRSSLAIYHLNNIVVASLVKALLLVVLLAPDVAHPSLLFAGILVSLVLLEMVRLIIERAVGGMGRRGCYLVRGVVSLAAGAVVIQVLARVAAHTPTDAAVWVYVVNAFRSLGETAACETIQSLAVPWLPAASLAVTEDFRWWTAVQLMAALGVVPLAVAVLVHVDRWAGDQRKQWERQQLADNQTRSNQTRSNQTRNHHSGVTDRNRGSEPRADWMVNPTAFQGRFFSAWADAGVLVLRQLSTVRRYAGSLAFSFVIPMLLSLSPLVVGRVSQQWFLVVAGLAMCTLVLAPSALRIDFRRDLKRMMLLRSLPIKPLPMAVGQLILPILITIAFQAVTIGIAAWFANPGAGQILLWMGMLSALTVFTFAAENALFLAYPHHERSEGLIMMVRVKLTFLGKTILLAIAAGMLLVWSSLCQQSLPGVWATGAYVSGALLFTWALAITGIAAVAWCWARFDIAADLPPE